MYANCKYTNKIDVKPSMFKYELDVYHIRMKPVYILIINDHVVNANSIKYYEHDVKANSDYSEHDINVNSK